MYLLLDNLTLWQQIVLLVTALIIFCVGVYSIDLWFLTIASIFHRKLEINIPHIDEWPKISIQLPFYNEQNVASRVLKACLNLDYPKDKLEIIIIDDSNDGTSKIVEDYKARNISLIKVIKRPNREGFKAGALQEALQVSKGEFISIFDADFIPSKDMLKKMIPYLCADKNIAFVQARWGYIDGTFSWYAKAISLAIDIYGTVDQLARYSKKLVPHFNGTAAIFRKSAVEAVGGWESDTLAEDLDLSIRLRLKGYNHIYLPGIACPGEIPPTFKTLLAQQYRWGRGFTECLKKYWRAILQSKNLSIFKKLESIVYLSTYIIPLLSIIGIVTGIIYLAIFPDNFYFDNLKNSIILIFNVLFSIIIYTAPLGSAIVAISKYKVDTRGKIGKIKNLIYLGIIFYALMITYSKAVIAGLTRKRGEFTRTPKIGWRAT